MLDFLWSILFFIVGIVLGFYLLLLGRRSMALTTAIVCLVGIGGLVSLIFFGENSAWQLTLERDWLLIGVTVAAGITGGIVGARAPQVAAGALGFFAGGYMALWLYDISYYLLVSVANLPEQTAFWAGVAIFAIGGLLGLYLTRRSEAIAVILISVFVGTDLIGRVLNLNSSKSITAVILISASLLGLVVQYAQYLREIRADGVTSFTPATAAAPAPEYFDLSDD